MSSSPSARGSFLNTYSDLFSLNHNYFILKTNVQRAVISDGAVIQVGFENPT